MRYYNEITGQEQSSAGGIFDAHIKPIPSSEAENKAHAAVLTVFVIVLIGWWISFSWNWSKWVIRHSNAWIVASVLFLFNMIYPLWVFGWSVTGMTFNKIILDGNPLYLSSLSVYLLVIGTVFWITICRYLALPTEKKIKIAQKNKQDREIAKNSRSILNNPLVFIPTSYWIGRTIV